MRNSDEDPTAVHSVTEDGAQVVGFGNIHVLLIEEDGQWYAQCLEVDHRALGGSFDDAGKNFEVGLLSTIRADIRKHGSIAPLLIPAPEIWKETLHPNAKARRFSCASIHLGEILGDVMNFLPFNGINYLLSDVRG